MLLIPYKRKKYETEFTGHRIIEKLRANTLRADWNISFDKAINNRIFEGDISNGSFLVVMGRYALSYGKTSLLPIMKGRIKCNDDKSLTAIDIVIRPFAPGIIIISFFYSLAIFGIILSLHRGDTKALFFFMSFYSRYILIDTHEV